MCGGLHLCVVVYVVMWVLLDLLLVHVWRLLGVCCNWLCSGWTLVWVLVLIVLCICNSSFACLYLLGLICVV